MQIETAVFFHSLRKALGLDVKGWEEPNPIKSGKEKKRLGEFTPGHVTVFKGNIERDFPNDVHIQTLLTNAHELGHAWQHQRDLPMDENRAEDFAAMVVYTGYVCTGILHPGFLRSKGPTSPLDVFKGIFLFDPDTGAVDEKLLKELMANPNYRRY